MRVEKWNCLTRVRGRGRVRVRTRPIVVVDQSRIH